jgi:hypothetical protein
MPVDLVLAIYHNRLKRDRQVNIQERQPYLMDVAIENDTNDANDANDANKYKLCLDTFRI